MKLIARLLYLIFLFHGQFGAMLRAIIQKLEGKGGDRQVRKPVTEGVWFPACLHSPVAGAEWGYTRLGFGRAVVVASPVCWHPSVLLSCFN